MINLIKSNLFAPFSNSGIDLADFRMKILLSEVEKISEKKRALAKKYEKISRDGNFLNELIEIETELSHLEEKFKDAVGNFQSGNKPEVLYYTIPHI